MSGRTNIGWRVRGTVAVFAALVAAAAATGGRARTPVHAASVERKGLTKPDTPDIACRRCHEKVYDSYERTPMAMGSGLAVDGLDRTELTAKDLVHAASGVTYKVFERDGTAYLAYERAGMPERYGIKGEHKLDYFVGSGRRGRTFLFEQEGLWFEAPINWYGKKQLWDMAPAYEGAKAMPDPLPVDPNCLHCHASGAQMSVGAVRNRYEDVPFRQAGVGCSACHGDGAAHIAAMDAGKTLKGTIVNPDKLDAVRRDSACIQCHLEGDAAIYLPGRSLAEFKPGDDLSKSVVYFIDNSKAQLGRRASSQYEALLRSACKRASGDKITCTTCHDPHHSPSPEERVAYFRAKCLTCHTGPEMATHHAEQQDCASCHMPTRKTADISHEQLTDHDIEARPGRPALELKGLGQTNERELVPVGKVTAGDRELGLAYAQLAQHGDRSSGERALRLLKSAEASGSDDADLHDQLGFLLQISGSAKSAADEYMAALKVKPGDTTAAANLAVLMAGAGESAEAVQLLSKVVEEDPSQTAAGLNLAFIECRQGKKAEAAKLVERMLIFNPDSEAGHRLLETGRYGGQVCSVR